MRDLAIATLGIAAAFSVPFLATFPLMLLVAASGLLLHELAHKYAAMNVGCSARFKMSEKGVLASILASALTLGVVKVGIPGAVHITSEQPRGDYMAQIAFAGPLVNIIVALMFGLIKYASPLALLIAIPNLSLACFNLLPVKPLDGSYIWPYSKKMWGLCFGLALAAVPVVAL